MRDKPWPGRPFEAVTPTMVANVEALISTVYQNLSNRSTSWFAEELQKLTLRWQKCIDIGGEYFAKE